jgi:hypothetical protein
MLGAGRSDVTEVALRLQDAGLIRYSHGHVEVVNQPGLEKRVYECYRVVKRELDRLLPALMAIQKMSRLEARDRARRTKHAYSECMAKWSVT